MRRMYPAMVIALMPLALFAQEAAAEVAAQTETQAAPWWAAIVAMIITALIVPFATNYLKKKADVAKAELDLVGLTKKEKIIAQLKVYGLERAASFAEKDLVTLSQMIAKGDITDKEKVKEYLRGLGRRLKDDLILYAKDQFGMDLIEELGNKYVDDLIEALANKVSPFPGKDTAVALLQGGADHVIKFGVNKADHYLDQGLAKLGVGAPSADSSSSSE